MTQKSNLGWNFNDTYCKLPQSFFSIINPIPVSKPECVLWNSSLATELGLNTHGEHEQTMFLSGNLNLKSSTPIALAYAGHQFGHFTLLGDGRAVLLGEHLTPTNKRYDLHLKGSGQTPYSRRGDGRAALGPMLREYIVSEAMHGLGIATTRSLAVIRTGESVAREALLPGAVLARIASSHIRVGTFQYATTLRSLADLKALADYTIERHYPDLQEKPQPYLRLLEEVLKKQADLIANWISVGFVHGVMNTDNMSISGETIDYGPCAFLDAYVPDQVFSSIDQNGRYAFANQPSIAEWNLTRFAETLLPLIDSKSEHAINLATEVLEKFPTLFQAAWLFKMRRKFGLENSTDDSSDSKLFQAFFDLLKKHALDLTRTFRDISINRNLNQLPSDFIPWLKEWENRTIALGYDLTEVRGRMQNVNPAIIARNYWVEHVIENASVRNDFTQLHLLHQALRNPFTPDLDASDFSNIPADFQKNYQTFCGT